MEEEVTQKTIALSIKTTKVTADVLRMMLRKYLEAQKQKGPNPYKQGKQTYDQLREQGVGLSNIQITDGNIKSFERVAREFKIDFALKREDNGKPPTYYVFFKAPDKPSIMEKLAHFKDTVSKGMNRERAKEHQKDRGQSL